MPADRTRAGTALALDPSVPVDEEGRADASTARPRPDGPGTRQPVEALGRELPDGPAARPGLDASVLLSVWEEGAGRDPARRAISLLSAAWPSPPFSGPGNWLHVSVGGRDGWLLTLREELFGDRLETAAACPACESQLEIALRTSDVRVPAPDPSTDAVVCVEMDGYRVEGRPPTSADLLAALHDPDASVLPAGHAGPDGGPGGAGSGTAALLRRCIRVATRGSVDVDPAALPAAVTEAVARAMADADPQADVRLALQCPDCGHPWSSPFDVLSYLWDEIDDWVTRLLREVHALASAYGWSERDILGMSARRRRLYLEMCGGAA